MSGHKKVSPKLVTATPVPLKANETSSTKKADKSGFSSTDQMVTVSAAPAVEINPAGDTTHVATPEGVDLWG